MLEGARLTFRAGLMPCRDAAERTFTVARVLAHAPTEFEPAH
jgi:hypothetical protein